MKEIINPSIEIKKELKPVCSRILEIENIDPETQKIIESIKLSGLNLDWDENEDFFDRNKIKNKGRGTYLISESDSKNKYSQNYDHCTGVILVGTALDGKEICLMSHQNPDNFLEKKKEEFTDDLLLSIDEFIKKVEKNSIDSVIFGGNRGGNVYLNSIKLLASILQSKLGFEPTVMTGPNDILNNSKRSSTDIFFDTQKRLLYIIRSAQDNSKFDESYLPSELEEKRKSWFE